MRYPATWLVIAALTVTECHAQAPHDSSNFAKLLYERIDVQGMSINFRDVAGVTDSQRTRLVAARAALREFIRAVGDVQRDPLKLLSADLRRKYRSRAEVATLFPGEAYPSMQVYDFTFARRDSVIGFRYFLSSTSEGTLCDQQHSAHLVLTGDGWKVSGLEDLPTMR